MRFLIRTALLVLAIIGISYFVPDVYVEDVWTAFILVIVLGILNMLVKPLLILLTIPVTIITFGLFLLVINTIIVLMADYIIDGFNTAGFQSAFLFALALSVVNFLIDRLIAEKD